MAQHSVIVSEHVALEQEHALYGLLHDAAEAYLVDLPRPLKDLLPEYKVIEKKLETVIFKRFGLYEAIVPHEVDTIDKQLVMTEAIELGLRPQLWKQTIQPLPITITPVSPLEAKRMFLNRFKELAHPSYA